MDAVSSKNVTKIALVLFVVLSSLLVTAGCESNHRYRPFGWFRLGKVSDFLAAERDLPESKLIVKRDDKGLYVMSTICTYDLTYLTRKTVSGQERYVSDYSTSTYDLDGNVISGPAVAPLPHYELKIDFGVDGKARDTLYAIVGQEVPRDWRLPLPAQQVPPPSSNG